MLDDIATRERALQAEDSFIAQAPAGSGKTELLIQRYLKLLSRVDSPESIVAITFTKKAAGEMRARVLEALRQAAQESAPDSPHQAITHELARQALARDAANRWQLLQNPARIRVQTIDSLSASITRQMPWLSRFGAFPEITEKAAELYREAARNTLRMLKDEEREDCEGSLSTLLLHLDNDYKRAERLIAQMLEKRDQWLRRTGVTPDLEDVRAGIEMTLERLIARELTVLRAAIPGDAVRDVLFLLDLDALPACSSAGKQDWLRLADLVLTSGGAYRVKVPKDTPRERWTRLLERLKRDPDPLLARLKEARRLPPTRFEDSQWEILKALVDVLPKAVAHLNLVFRARGRVDFAELSIRALDALGNLESPSDLALALGYRIEHLLVDEFQDTSFTQYDLLHKLTMSWEPGDGRTLFLVGDPMQSIYRFREADVSLFLKARLEGIGNIRLEPLTLTSNFRSDGALIEWFNRTFVEIFPKEEDIDRGAVRYSPSVAQRPANAQAPVAVHPFLGEDQASEAERILTLIGDSTTTTAILVRARSHLAALVSLLRRHNIPFQAIEIDQLGERAVIQDLMALTFSLLHLADRISWLAVLRAPWCGLTLEDLHTIAADSRPAIWDLLRQHQTTLTPEGQSRVERCLPVLEKAVEQRGRVPLRALVEDTWLRLGGPACVADDSEIADANAYFDLLEGLEEAGDLPNFALLREQVSELFAQPDSKAGDRLQIMTIHKAKGLEFDRVILPGLGQRGRGDDTELLIFQEQQGELLLAPMQQTRGDSDPIYDYVKHLGNEKSRQETARLLYVAATRARHELHLLGCARWKEKEQIAVADSDTFLKLLWPAIGHHYTDLRPTDATAAQTTKPVRMIRHLPLRWTLPARPPAIGWKHAPMEPSETPEEEITYEWVGDTRRHTGTVLHRFLSKIAVEGIERCEPGRLPEYRATFRAMLSSLGVPPAELPEACASIEKALQRTLQDERARWILTAHAEAESEFEITGLVEGKLHQAVIDRTFIDEQGVRWIIDYKTGEHTGGSLENFLENEKDRYQPQLERYARLLAQQDERPIRLGLYFPLLQAWREWAAPTIQRRQASLFE